MPVNPFSSVEIFQDYENGHVIQWTLLSSFNDPMPHTFFLECTETADFSSLLFSKNVGNGFFAVDETSKKTGTFTHTNYRVKLVTPTLTYFSSPLIRSATLPVLRKELMAQEIIRKEKVRLKYTGEFGYLLKRKTTGQISTNTVDPRTKVPIADSTEDYGVGYLGGYYAPVQINFTPEEYGEQTAFSEGGLGIKNSETYKIKLVGFPAIVVKDIIVNNDNVRHVVTKIERTLFPGTKTPILQSIAMSMVPIGDTIYKIAVPRI